MVNDTICALATPAGGAIGIIRISGCLAIKIADSIFHPKSKSVANEITASKGKSLSEAHTQTVHYGCIEDGEGNIVDDVLVTVFRAPHSYTGEDSVEISCHGSRYILDQVLRLLIDNGCRQANPGEYTQRAFLNGKMDLIQAEAVADLIASTNQATHRMAIGQLRGNISTELSYLRDRLLKMTSLLELELDFSDHEELEFADRGELLELAHTIDNHITRLASTFASGRAIKQGIPVAIVGKTNVGKSTLLNLLLGDEKAIVSEIHGTTRDVIEDSVDINGVTFRFIDTAGIRHTSDEIERIGIERTFRKLNEATIVLWLLDILPTSDEIEDMANLCQGKKLIVVNNKIDQQNFTAQLLTLFPTLSHKQQTGSSLNRPSHHSPNIHLPLHQATEVIGISARNATNIEALRQSIYRLAAIPSIQENDIIVTSARHYEALCRAHNCITHMIEGLNMHLSGDLLSEELRLCLDHLAEITGGQITTNEVLGNIFKNFCIGK